MFQTIRRMIWKRASSKLLGVRYEKVLKRFLKNLTSLTEASILVAIDDTQVAILDSDMFLVGIFELNANTIDIDVTLNRAYNKPEMTEEVLEVFRKNKDATATIKRELISFEKYTGTVLSGEQAMKVIHIDKAPTIPN